MRAWVAKEDDFVLSQAKKKAVIRVKEGRAKPVDWLAVTLRLVDEERGVEREIGLEDDGDGDRDGEGGEEELEVLDPEAVFEGVEGDVEWEELARDIETYEKLERRGGNREYWRMMGVLCGYYRERRRKGGRGGGGGGRATSTVSSDIDRLLAPKTYEELEGLEKQIRAKLDSNEPIDTDYWQQLLDSLLVWKAKARLKRVYQAVLDSRLRKLRVDSEGEAVKARQELAGQGQTADGQLASIQYSKTMDPDSALEIASKDKSLEVRDERAFLSRIASDRAKVLRMGYVPLPAGSVHHTTKAKDQRSTAPAKPTPAAAGSTTQFDRDVARGVDEDEEIFASEEPTTSSATTTSRLRKPRYFNRVQLGYDWNKYNQTHYTLDAPPPKVVQGYKFHIFYPDLLDPTKSPTYKILREDGRKKGQTLAPAGEEDTCIIRFVSPGEPYEDVAFRIVDRDWDYSAKFERGFRSVFEGGVLSLHFSFKRVYYRK